MRINHYKTQEQRAKDGYAQGLKHRALIDLCDQYQKEHGLSDKRMAESLFTYCKDYELFKIKANTKPITLENICAIERLTGKKILNI